MSMTTVWALVALVVFIVILAVQKIPNWMTFLCMAPIVVFSGVMDASQIYAVLDGSGIHMMFIICMFSGMIAATGLDIVIGDFVGKMTGKATGARKEMIILAVIYVVSGLVSFLLQNSYVAFILLPVIYSIAKRNNISYSKMILFVIFSTTLGGACTLIGTPTNIYANVALESAGLELFGMFDFAWVGIPIFILGGLYMVLMHRWCPSYEETVPTESVKSGEITPAMKKKQIVVGICFLVFVGGLVTESVFKIDCNSTLIGYAMIAVSVLSGLVSPKEVMSSLNAEMLLFCAGINLLISIMNISGLGDIFANVILSILGDNKNLYFITAVLFIGSAVMTSFMNNMACAGALAPVGISIAGALGANPQAIVLAIAIGAGCSYLTPIASGTNQGLLVFTNLKFTDFAKFGWPLVIISFVCCVAILPLVFPFF